MHHPLRTLSAIGTILCTSCLPAVRAEAPPNIILIFTDDQGYGDLVIEEIKEVELYNLRDDPAESNNLVNHSRLQNNALFSILAA